MIWNHHVKKIYNLAQAELARVNAVYPKRQFALQEIDFNPPTPTSVRSVLLAAKTAERSSRQQLAISDKIIMMANVILSAKLS